MGVLRRGILVHQPGQEFLIERAPVGADAHRLVVLERHLDDGGELPVLLVLETDIAGIDAVFIERLGAGRVVGQQLVADVVEVADERHRHAELAEPFLDVRHRGRCLVTVDRNAHQFGAGGRQRRHLPGGASTSAVSVLVIDCTTIGAPPPTITPPTSTATDL